MRKMLSRKQTIDLVNEAIESGEIHADPSTEVKVGDINSESATAGKVIVADGDGGAEWGSVSGGTNLYLHELYVTDDGDNSTRIYFINGNSQPYTTTSQLISLYSSMKYIVISKVDQTYSGTASNVDNKYFVQGGGSHSSQIYCQVVRIQSNGSVAVQSFFEIKSMTDTVSSM